MQNDSRRTETIVDTHEGSVLCRFQRLRQHTMRPAKHQKPANHGCRVFFSNLNSLAFNSILYSQFNVQIQPSPSSIVKSFHQRRQRGTTVAAPGRLGRSQRTTVEIASQSPFSNRHSPLCTFRHLDTLWRTKRTRKDIFANLSDGQRVKRKYSQFSLEFEYLSRVNRCQC
jgi:hypothetical protein